VIAFLDGPVALPTNEAAFSSFSSNDGRPAPRPARRTFPYSFGGGVAGWIRVFDGGWGGCLFLPPVAKRVPPPTPFFTFLSPSFFGLAHQAREARS